jgi:hypothetical protein
MKNILFAGLISILIISCNDNDVQDTKKTTLINISEEMEGDNCVHGGTRFEVGFDLNEDSVLDSTEVIELDFICNTEVHIHCDCENGTDGENGNDTLFILLDEEPGSNCEFGGKSIRWGVDTNDDGSLTVSEITNLDYICNGEPGKPSIIVLKTEEAGPNCEFGGTGLIVGVDVDDNGTIDATEETSRSYVCNGYNGLNSILRQEDEIPGAICTNGGRTLISGLDSDDDGYLDANEIENVSYCCNDYVCSLSFDSLHTETPVSNAPSCPGGGYFVETGLDLDGNTNLDVGEITNSEYVCGNNIEIQAFDAIGCGYCVDGGVKILSGEDINTNDILDNNEITKSEYICN